MSRRYLLNYLCMHKHARKEILSLRTLCSLLDASNGQRIRLPYSSCLAWNGINVACHVIEWASCIPIPKLRQSSPTPRHKYARDRLFQRSVSHSSRKSWRRSDRTMHRLRSWWNYTSHVLRPRSPPRRMFYTSHDHDTTPRGRLQLHDCRVCADENRD
jgi:hypothetical protein